MSLQAHSSHLLLQTMEQAPDTMRHITLKETITKLSKTISHQKQILYSGTIPKQYRPKDLFIATPTNDLLYKSFRQKYETLFFDHIRKVIKENEISLELKKMKLQSLAPSTEGSQPLQPIRADKHPPVNTKGIQPRNLKTTHGNKASTHSFTSVKHAQKTSKLSNHHLQHTKSTPTETIPPNHSKQNIPTESTLTPLFKQNRKRKSSTPHPKSLKQTKIDSFLGYGPNKICQIP